VASKPAGRGTRTEGAAHSFTPDVAPARADVTPPRFGYRWTICALLFCATTISYVDRQVLGILAPTLQRELGWSEVQYADIVSWFSFAYGIGLLGAGRLLDRVGVRAGFSATIVVWSIAAIATARATTVGAFEAMRALLGLGEAGNCPASLKTVAEWFPKRERALAVGVFNAGSNVGAIIAPIAVPWIAVTWGWREAFVATGALGFIWLIFWLAIYREPDAHPRLSKAELAIIRSDPTEASAPISWASLLRHRQTWAFAAGKALTDPIWLFYLFWLPKFLDARFNVKLTALAAPIVAVYLTADVGSVAGGWLSSHLIARGWTVNRARKVTMLIAALLIMPTAFAPFVDRQWLAIGVVAMAAASHQWWSANLFTTVSDMFPRRAVASVVGIGGFVGAMSAMLFQRATGVILERTGGRYGYVFAICGCAYIVALAAIHLLAPRLEPVSS
jgi:ACS family hexuronate transporter-like MFS transporter